MIKEVMVKGWQCEACKDVWIGRGEEKPKRCPNRECRKREGKKVTKEWIAVDTVERAKEAVAIVTGRAEMAECKRCGAVILRDPKNQKYWKCGVCKRQLDDREVKIV